LRKENEELRYGTYKTLYARDGIISFKREYKGKSIIVIINNSSKEHSILLNGVQGKLDILGMGKIK
jgi:hypothetical protein